MPITNSTQNVLMYGFNGTNPDRVEINGSGHLKCNVENSLTIASMPSITTDISGQTVLVGNFPATQTVDGSVSVSNFPATQPVSGSVSVSNNTDPATGTLQTAGNASLSTIAGDTTSLDGKITACNTGAVVVSSSALPSGASTATLQTAGNASLTSMDGKITACDTGNIAGSISVSNNTDPATATLQTAGNASAATVAGSHYIEGGTIGVSDTGVLIMGRNGTNAAKPIHITNNGDVEVEIADFVKGQALASASFPVVLASDSVVSTKITEVVNKGSFGNIANNTTLNLGSQTGAADISEMNSVNLVYTDTATSSFDGLAVFVSGDGTNYDILTELYPTNNGAGTLRYANFEGKLGGLTHIKLENTSAADNYTNVKASVFGCPN